MGSTPFDATPIQEGGQPGSPTGPAIAFQVVPVAAIRPNPRQPRTVFDEDALDELVASIREVGLLQPLVVRPAPSGPVDGFELVAGERRWRSVQRLGWDSVPVVVRMTEDNDLLRDALLENLHRAALNPLEEAAAYQQLLVDLGCTQDELAARVGRSRPQITNTLRLLRLPPAVQRRVAAGVLSQGHARALLGLPDAAAMERLAARIVAEGLSVRTVEELVALGEVPADAPARRPRTPRRLGSTPGLEEVAEALADRLDTRVQVSMGRAKGKVTIEFAGPEDLARIVALLDGTGTAT
jgi:ParB family chromosome partitioning protein